ncbi:putative leader peptide [Streptomyces sp. NBC_01275]|nr:putative leader peptide [Streptomyces sp. NBC_01275]
MSEELLEELLLHGRVHVDLVRTASARCPGR